jgi:hypothetical protein
MKRWLTYVTLVGVLLSGGTLSAAPAAYAVPNTINILTLRIDFEVTIDRAHVSGDYSLGSPPGGTCQITTTVTDPNAAIVTGTEPVPCGVTNAAWTEVDHSIDGIQPNCGDRVEVTAVADELNVSGAVIEVASDTRSLTVNCI